LYPVPLCRDLGTQSSQLLSLQPELANFPGRVLIHSIIPAVSRLCLAAPNLWVYAMPLHAELAKQLPEDKYVFYAGPFLGKLLAWCCAAGVHMKPRLMKSGYVRGC
jgi:hypothetical protein